jgi:trans-2,3-dihydro-3-hydroxyanthranilate isomerase
MNLDSLTVTIVDACLRDGHGGSPTAVLDDADLSDAQRRAVPGRTGTSHAVFLRAQASADETQVVGMRFFTAVGELPGCGHGTVAGLALLAERGGRSEQRFTVRAGGRSFAGHAVQASERFEARFDPGVITARRATAAELGPVLAAMGLHRHKGTGSAHVASLGRPRLLVRAPSRAALATLAPDPARLAVACDLLGLLGCYVYVPSESGDHFTARMFAPSIGVPEDIANANSTACLAALLSDQGIGEITVDMGDSLSSPATVVASTQASRSGPRVLVGGSARIRTPSVLMQSP